MQFPSTSFFRVERRVKNPGKQRINTMKESLMAVLRTTSSMMTTVHRTLVIFVYIVIEV